MELILKLAKSTFSFNINGTIDLQYKEDCIEIIETPVTKASPVVTTVKEVKVEPPTPVVKQPVVITSNLVTNNNSKMEKDREAALRILNNIPNDKFTLVVRKYLGSRLSDKQFDIIIGTLYTYVHNASAITYTKCDMSLRVSRLAYCAMFIMARFSYNIMRDFMHTKGDSKLWVSKDFFSTLKHGKSKSSFVIASALWPQYIRENRSSINQEKYLDKYEQVLEALLAGYSPYKIIAYSGVSRQAIYNIRNGINWANQCFDYVGPYPIKATPGCRDIEVRVCKDCGKVIPVKRIKAQPDAEYCVDCQRKYEKA